MLGFHICIYDISKKINHLLYIVCDSQELWWEIEDVLVLPNKAVQSLLSV